LIGINDVGAGNLDGADKLQGHYLRNMWRALLYRSEVYSMEQNLYHHLIARSRGLRHTEIDLMKAEILEHPSAKAQQTLQDYLANSVPFFTRRLKQLIQISQAHGIEPVLITQPTLYGPGIDPVTGVNLATLKIQDKMNGRMMFDFIEIYNEVTRQVAQKEKVLLIDLASDLPRNSAYYYDYLHYTESGAAAVAAIVYRRLAPWLAQRFTAFKK